MKNIQRALQGKRQQNSTLIILDRYIAAKRPLNRCGRLGEALAEFWAPERMKTDEGMLKGPASFFQRDFVGAYTCFHKRWLSPEDSAAADKDPDHFKNEDGELRVGGVPEPVKGYRPVEFPVCAIHFRPSAGCGNIEMTETASPYLDYKNSPGYSPEPPVLEGALSAADAKDRYFGVVAAERGHHKMYQIRRGAEDKETGVPEWNGTVVSEGRMATIHLVPHPDQRSIGDYFPDELLSEAKNVNRHSILTPYRRAILTPLVQSRPGVA